MSDQQAAAIKPNHPEQQAAARLDLLNTASNGKFHTSLVIFSAVEFTVMKRYKQLKPIGSGAQGTVCSAFDEILQKRVAIKKLNVVRAKHSYREFKIMNHFNHPNIVGLLNVFTPQETLQDFKDLYLVMQLMDTDVSGLDFNLDHERISSLIYQMLCGVEHLHSAGILHRDLKPSNIAVSDDGNLKILDFGLARAKGTKCMMTEYVVTRHYRAPEILLRIGYKEASDVWSVGCIFAEMISNTVLFPGTSSLDQIRMIFQTLGTPRESFVERQSQDFKSWFEMQPKFQGKSFTELFPMLYQSDDPQDKSVQARELLESMLVIDPESRATIGKALASQYLEPWSTECKLNVPAPGRYDSLDESKYTLDQWRSILFDLVKDYERSQIQANDESATNQEFSRTEANTEQNIQETMETGEKALEDRKASSDLTKSFSKTKKRKADTLE